MPKQQSASQMCIPKLALEKTKTYEERQASRQKQHKMQM